MNLCLIIPAYNEVNRLPGVLDAWKEQGIQPKNIVVVANGCSDGTADMARGYGCTTIEMPSAGKWNALRTGINDLAQQRILYDAALLVDCDLSVPPHFLDRFIRRYEYYADEGHCPLVIASREEPDSVRFDEPALRHVLGRGYSLAARLAIPGIGDLLDTQCGFKLAHWGQLKAIAPTLRVDGFGGDVELIARWRQAGSPVLAEPVVWYYQTYSTVRPLRDSLRMAVELAAARKALLRYG